MADRTSTEILLEIVGAQKRFGSTEALRDAHLAVRAGEVHALLGGNGAGKSTLISIIAGAATPDAGQLRVRGTAIAFGSPRDALARGIAVVYQELSALPHLTVAENIGLGNPRRRGIAFAGRARATPPRSRSDCSASTPRPSIPRRRWPRCDPISSSSSRLPAP